MMTDSRNDTPTEIPHGKKSLVRAVISTVVLVLSAGLTAYGTICPTSMGRCLPSTANHIISGTSVFLLVVGILVGLTGIYAAVESIADSEKTRKPYIALALLLVSTLGITGELYVFVILKIVSAIFPGKV